MGAWIDIDLAKVEQYAKVCKSEEEIANALGISYSTLRNRKREFDSFDSAIKRGKAQADIFVGGKLMELIKAGNVTAIIFYLKTRCGWKESVDVNHSGAVTTKTNISISEKEREALDKYFDENF